MADFLMITPQPITTTATSYSASGALELRLSIDVSMYDLLDLQCYALAIKGNVTNFDVRVLHAFQRDYEDESWDVTNSTGISVLTTFAFTTTYPKLGNAQAPSSGNPMFRYIRWQAKQTGGTSVTWTLMAMARRRSF